MEQLYNARDRTVLKNGRDGVTKENLHTKETKRVSKKEAEFLLNEGNEADSKSYTESSLSDECNRPDALRMDGVAALPIGGVTSSVERTDAGQDVSSKVDDAIPHSRERPLRHKDNIASSFAKARQERLKYRYRYTNDPDMDFKYHRTDSDHLGGQNRDIENNSKHRRYRSKSHSEDVAGKKRRPSDKGNSASQKESGSRKYIKRLLFYDEAATYGRKASNINHPMAGGIIASKTAKSIDAYTSYHNSPDDADDISRSLAGNSAYAIRSGYEHLGSSGFIRSDATTARSGLRFQRSNSPLHSGQPNNTNSSVANSLQNLAPLRRTTDANTHSIRVSGKSNRNRQLQKKRYQREYHYAKNRKTRIVSTVFFHLKSNPVTPSNTSARSARLFLKDTILRAKKAGQAALASLGLVLVMVMSSFSGCVAMIGGMTTVMASTYPGTDEDIRDAEAAYCELENRLDGQINSIEDDHPGYDEYRYSVDEITHNPFQLTSLLSAKFGNYTPDDVADELKVIFDLQYTLTIDEETETRTRMETVTKTRTVTDPDTGEKTQEEYEDTVEVEYEYRILKVTLVNHGVDYVAGEYLAAEELGLYQAYNATLGNRKELFDESQITASPGGGAGGGNTYDIPAEALSDEGFKRMITEAEKYLGYPYVWGGSSPSTSFDCSGFVSWVINHCGNGWNVGRQTAEGLRGLCTAVSKSGAKPGDLIFFKGTYNTGGASHVGIYVGSGMMIHCGSPIQYANINTPYWQSHFYQFGRLP